jgi:hypothetical protein
MIAANQLNMPSSNFAPPAPAGFVGRGGDVELGQNWRISFRDADGIPLNMQSFEVIDFGAISYKEIFQNVKTIVATPIWSAALERTLGVDARIVDLPIGSAAEATVVLLQAIYFWEPRAQVTDIQFDADVINGHLIATLKLNINNVIYGTDTPYTQANIFGAPSRVVGELPHVNEPVLIPGPPGATGQRGSIWFTGAGDPSTAETANVQPMDLYLNTSNGDVWQFIADGSAATWRKANA